MNEKVFFTEEQKFKQWWLWLILLGINVIFIVGIIKQIYYKEPYGDNPASNTILLLTFCGTVLFTLLFYYFKLQTIIKLDGIYVRFFPIQIAYKKYSWESLNKTYIRKYSPLGEYGGWGFRFGIFGNGYGNALNVSGNMGLQLKFLDKTNLLIGTNKPEELKKILIKMDKYKE